MLRPPEPAPLPGLAGFIETYKPVLPLPVLALVLTCVWLLFRRTWRELDEDSQRARAELLAKGRMDHRPFVALVLIACILTVQDYYGGRIYFDTSVGPWLADVPWARYAQYDELWSFVWWAGTRILGYALPFAVWPIFFREDSLRDLGLRTRGFFDHAWIYTLFLLVVVPAMLVVSQNPDFGAYYPFYKQSSRSWFDFLAWEALYFGQFFALEMFFRGFWLGVLRRSFGSGAIFVMAVPYCMIHYGKPYLEACGAIVAGIALGSLAMKTRSIYQGFLLHITVAVLMDWLSLRNRKATPLHLWPSPGPASQAEWAVEEAQREALAHRVELVAACIFAVLLALLVAFVVRSLRRRRARV